MAYENDSRPYEATRGAAPTPARLPRTRHQIKAALIADGLAVKARWKTLMADATTVWKKIPVEDLVKAEGNISKIAGMVQLRYQVSRQESDQQVKDFFDRHATVAPAA